MFAIEAKGNFKRTREWLASIHNRELFRDLERWGQMGVDALNAATPRDSGLSAGSWQYRVIRNQRWPGIEWYNVNAAGQSNTPVVILIQYGHATRSGGYIQGRDFINPAMKPVFEKIRQELWKKVRS
jgi:hypothetical protein